MTTKKMLIDATQPEETRVVILSGNRLENFDVEVESRKQLKGNIYLAKVTRVEPSLQAAFVDYGGNRHGFLAFNEIHPDYYQIPVADRQELIKEHEAAEKAEEESLAETVGEEDGTDVETLGGDESEEVEERRPSVPRKRYKIQEVIKRRQILLVQVVKEERGTKGAALTTYLSLAGRYCVLMPNTARGGGISRKITNAAERKKMRTILGDLGISEGMAVIMRTAGINRTKTEIKRDYEYLVRLWDQIRKDTLQSSAPCLIHEEANLIKRSIRDLYSRDISEVLVEGEEGYKPAKEFMKLLIPSHAKRVKKYDETDMPLFQRFQVEGQLDAMLSPIVHLKSGGYIVINPTEALVAIDVNSGRSTRERNIEETALRTNLEASEEIARQVRLRDLAGLIVIDFIDMEVHRNNAQVERRLKDCMADDRARIQIGRISHFGLLELSRQRLRPSLMETNFEACIHCGGTGVVRSIESTALTVLRSIEEEATQRRAASMTVHTPSGVAMYLLNQKRVSLQSIEDRHGVPITVINDDSLIHPDFNIETDKSPAGDTAAKPERREKAAAPEQKDTEKDKEEAAPEEDGSRKRRRRPRRRRKSTGEHDGEQMSAESGAPDADAASDTETETEADTGPHEDQGGEAQETKTDGDDAATAKPRRRGRRGGRRRSRKTKDLAGGDPSEATDTYAAPQTETAEPSPNDKAPVQQEAHDDKTPDSREHTETPEREREEEPFTDRAEEPADTAPENDPIPQSSHTTVIDVGAAKPAEDANSQRRGWWQR
ncbi:MAG: Rne/Rng family ribonuclease [Rhodospirillales bacterium]